MKPLHTTPRRAAPRHTARNGLASSALVAALLLGLLAVPSSAWAEYRAYELEVVDRYNCAIQKQNPCETAIVTSSLPPDVFARVNGGQARTSVMLRATWMCHGDTSDYTPVCPRPPARQPKFSVGDPVEVRLVKHVTNGWQGQVELAYFQAAIQSNVYGVRFPDRANLFARYFEKDLAAVADAADPAAAPAPAAAAAQ